LIIAAKGGGTAKNKMGVWLETIIIDFFFATNGWIFSNRIQI
jgi:hypothetical protein